MNQRIQSRFACLLAAAATFLVHGVSQASPEFPAAIEAHLGMQCPPPCSLCHEDPAGGGPTRGGFVVGMIVGGLKVDEPETVAPALDAVGTALVDGDNNPATPAALRDTDGDGVADVAELQAGYNPLVPSVPGDPSADLIICPPTYGCGARVATEKPIDGSALAFAFVVAGYLALRSRRRA